MKCKRSITLMALAFTLVLVPAAITYATKPSAAEGDWWYTPAITGVREADGNTFIYGTDEGGWSGTFVGTSTENFIVVEHRSGFAWYKGTILFEGTAGGTPGTLVISTYGKKLGAADWSGKWVILSGTGDLANLHGQGTWWGPGWQGDPEVPGELEYEGKIHFDPS